MRNFIIKAIDAAGRRWEGTQAATSCAEAEQLAADVIGPFLYLSARGDAA